MSLAVVLVLAVTGCSSAAGSAAIVGSHRISPSDVEKYLTPKASPFAAQSGATIVPKNYVLSYLIRQELIGATIAKNGGPATGAELTTARAAALGTSTDQQVTQLYTARGFQASFEPIVVQVAALLGVLQTRLGGSTVSSAQFVQTIKATNIRVHVSQRYGSWDTDKLALNAPGATLPDYLKVDATSTPTSTPTG